MQSWKPAVTVAVATAIISLSSHAYAESSLLGSSILQKPDNSSLFFGSVGATSKFYNAPNYHGNYSNLSAGQSSPTSDSQYYIDYDEMMVLSGPQIEAGFYLPENGLTDIIGQNPRAMIKGHYLSGDDSETVFGKTFASGNTGQSAVNGTNAVNQNFADRIHNTFIDVDQKDRSFEIIVAADRILSESLTITPLLAIGYENASSEVDTREFIPVRNDLVTQNFDFDTDGFKTRIGSAVNYTATSWLDLGLSGFVGASYRKAKLNASDCGDGFSTDLFGVCDGSGWRTSVSDSDHTIALLSGIALGVTAHTGSMALNFNIGAEYDSSVASYWTPSGADGGTARVNFEDQISGYASVMGTIRF